MLEFLYPVWNFCTVIVIILFTICAAKKRSVIAKNIVLIYSILSACILFYTFSLFTKNAKAAATFFGIYHAFLIWMLYAIFQFIATLTEISGQSKIISFLKHTFFILAIIDSVGLAVNIFSNYLFVLTPAKFSNTSLNYWNCQILPPFYFHIFLNALMILLNFACLLVRAYKLPHFYRTKYVVLDILFLTLALLTSFSRKINSYIDFSLCFYIFIVSYAFYIAFFGMNKSLLESMLSLVSDNINYGVACFDEKERCFFLNHDANAVFGYGKKGYASAEGYKNKLKRIFPNAASETLNLTQEFPIDGIVHKYKCESKTIRDKKKRTIVSYIKLEDTTEQIKRLEQEKIRTEHDALTGLYNRKAFFEYAAEILRKNPDEDFYLLATNIMDFKILNNLFGEDVGNELLKLQAQKMQKPSLPNKICGRISGDKFSALIPKKYFDKERLLNNNAELQAAVRKYNFKIQNYIGVYEISDKFENVTTMYDKALLTISTIRGNLEKTIAFYDMSLMEKIVREKQIISEFDGALFKNKFAMYLHPQVDAHSSKVLGAEALVRWIEPPHTIYPPVDFIPVLERSGLIHKLDQYMWENAAEKLAQWTEVGNDMYISINISPKDFYYCDIFSFLAGLVEKYKIAPQKLNIEITETVLMQNMDASNNILQKMHDYGFTIEMDDFGSGYSSLNTLENLEMDILKIDMAFLKDWNINKKSRDIISAIVTMSKSLGMTVISEGIESHEQADFLRETGCDIFQGYFFSKPLPIEEFEARYVKGGENGQH